MQEPKLSNPRLYLGTAQWGMDYGCANVTGQPSLDEIKAMLKIARDNNIYHLDTAQCYGDSEKILGLCNVMKSGFKVSTKLKLENSSFTKDYIARMCEKSLSNLKSDHLNGLMIHNSEEFLGQFRDPIWEQMVSLRKSGKVENIGISIYNPNQLELIFDLEGPLKVQIPLNLYDQRFLSNGLIELARANGIVIQARSIFLQGLFSLDHNSLPSSMRKIRNTHKSMRDSMNEQGLNPLAGAMQFCKGQPNVNEIVIGCETPSQLREIIQYWNYKKKINLSNLSRFRIDDLDVIDPRNWP